MLTSSFMVSFLQDIRPLLPAHDRRSLESAGDVHSMQARPETHSIQTMSSAPPEQMEAL